MKVINRKIAVLILTMALLICHGISYAGSPTWGDDYVRETSISESTPIGTEVARISATDPDGDTLTFGLIASRGDFSVETDGNSAVVKVSSNLDYERCRSYCIKITFSDGDDVHDWGLAIVMIAINDELGRSQGVQGQATRLTPPLDPISPPQNTETQENRDPNQREFGITPKVPIETSIEQKIEIVQRDSGQQSSGLSIKTSTEQKIEIVQQSPEVPVEPYTTVFDTVAAPGQVGFSEVMFATRGGLHSLPQWIELYNNSSTATVSLRGWHLEIEARDTNGSHRYAVISLDHLPISPNQTALIVTWRARNSGGSLNDRVYSFFSHHSADFEQNEHRNMVLGRIGFFLKLSNPKGVVIDVVGNLDGDRKTKDEPSWELPLGETADGARTSLQRRYTKGTGLPLDGTDATNWVPSSELELSVMTYWGRSTDIGNPGYRVEGDLPLEIISDVGSAPNSILQVPKESTLFANYPNPFNPETWIPYHLAKSSDVQITIYDVRGTVVRRLELGHQREGYYTSKSRSAYWDGRNSVGERVGSGIYFYQFQTDNVSLLRKMLILK